MTRSDEQEMTCRELVELVTEYLEGALPPADRQRFTAHLADCEGCARHVAQVQTTVAAVGALREEHLPRETRDALLEAFRDWKRPPGAAPGSP
jgi:anti-sigma factor RsiW